MRSAAVHALVATCPRVHVYGFLLVDMSSSVRFEVFTNRVREALRLIEAHDPMVLARMQRYLKRIGIYTGGGEHYDEMLNACIIDSRSLETYSSPELAAALVHEATHARLSRAGIATSDDNQARIERVCTEAAASFVEKVPETEALANRLRTSLSRPWWTKSDLRNRKLEQLRANGVPRWLIALYGRFILK